MSDQKKEVGAQPLTYHIILAEVLERLKSYDPDRVILFGSGARGEVNEESDLDLLIIKKTKTPPLRRMREATRICRGDVPTTTIGIDCLVYTPSEIQDRLKLGDPFITEIMAQGKVIYERKRSASG